MDIDFFFPNRNISKKAKWLNLLVFIFFGAFILTIVGMGVYKIIEVNHFLNRQVSNQHDKTVKKSILVGDLKGFTARIPSDGNPEKTSRNEMIISALNFHSVPTDQTKDRILKRHTNDEQPLYGLDSAPSFVMKSSDITFWRWQLYFQILFYSGGLAVIEALFLMKMIIDFKKSKYFINPMRAVVYGYTLLFMGGAALKWADNVIIKHFLTSHYNFNIVHAPIPAKWFLVGIAIFSAAPYLSNALSLQKEQDLTV